MAAAQTTACFAEFGGRRRRFCLRIGEIGELEQLCDAGVGQIWRRVAMLDFRFVDIRETIRLGLVGGEDMPSGKADALVKAIVDQRPLADHVELATQILRALMAGVEEASKDMPGKAPAAGSAEPATSPSSSSPARPSE